MNNGAISISIPKNRLISPLLSEAKSPFQFRRQEHWIPPCSLIVLLMLCVRTQQQWQIGIMMVSDYF